MVMVRPPSGSSSFGVGAAGVASHHAAVIHRRTVSPSGLPMCPPDADTCVWGEYACS